MRRLVITALVLAAAVLIARGPDINPIFRGGALADARETAAYRLDATGTRFPLSAGTRRLRILTNLDLPSGAADAGVGFSLRVAIPEEQYDERFALLGMPRVRHDGAPAVFYLGEPAAPAWTREISLERRGSAAATLEVSLVDPQGARGSVRVLAEAERAPLAADLVARRSGPIELSRLASSLGPLDWDQLPEALQDDLLERRWARLPAVPETQSRRLYVAGPPAPLSPAEPPGELLEAGQIIAYTVQGPGTLRLFASGAPAKGAVELLEADGQSRTLPLDLKAGDRLDLSVGRQLTTARVQIDERAQILAVISDRTMAIATARVEPRPDGEWAVHPAVVVERNPRAEAAPASPVLYDLRGRDGRELRLSARLSSRPGAGPTTAHVRWVFRDEARRALASGVIDETLAPAPEDRIIEEPEAVPTEPLVGHLWPPPSASTLEIASDPPALIAVDSPGFPPADGSPDFGSKPLTALRHAPVERPMWFRVRPSNEDELRAGGRMERLRSATRLDRLPVPPPPSGLAETLVPLERPPAFKLLLPYAPGARPADRGVFWPLSSEVASKVTLEPLPGSSSGARLPLNLLYFGAAPLERQEVAIRVDAAEPIRAKLLTSRGTLALPPLPAGAHRVTVGFDQGRSPARGPTPAPHLFLDHPTGSPTPFHFVTVHPLRAGARATLRLKKSDEARSLGAVLYFDGAPGEDARLEVTIDRGHRDEPATRFSRSRTRLVRTLPVQTTAVRGASFLNRRAARVWASAPIFVGLGDDIPAGRHLVSLTLKGTTAKAFVRFFSYGGPQHRPERYSAFGEFRSYP